jgi:hypothetical protein
VRELDAFLIGHLIKQARLIWRTVYSVGFTYCAWSRGVRLDAAHVSRYFE